MSDHSIKASVRTDEGKGASRRLRHAAQIPAIVYGGHAEPKSIQLQHEKTWVASQNEWFYSSILSLDVDGAIETVLLHFINVENSPAGKASDVVVTHELNEVNISCLPKDLPEFLELDLGALEVGDTIHLSQVKLPAGVEVPELKLGTDHDVAVVVARHARVEAEQDATEAAAAEAASAASAAVKEEDESAEGDEK
jgi:large subunit ribosomal protein L25